MGKNSTDLATLAAVLFITAAVALRFILILNNWPSTNSDEATVGLMALHIMQGHDFPAFLYGQGSLGALEAYMGAALFFIIGPGVLALRLGVLLFYIAFLISMYVLARLLYSKGVALVTLVVLGFGTPEILYRSIPAFAGHAETPLFGTLIVLVSTWIGLTSQPSTSETRPRVTRRLIYLYALWGIVAGAAFWNDALVGPFILMGGLFLLVCCRTLRLPMLVGLLLGLVSGLLPLILNDLFLSTGHSSPEVVGFLYHANSSITSFPLFERLAAASLVSLPISTGGTGICTLTNMNAAWPITSHTSLAILQCTVLHSIWAGIMVATWLIAVLMEVCNLRGQGVFPRTRKPSGEINEPTKISLDTALTALEERARVLYYARLLLLGSAAFTWLIFTQSIQSDLDSWGNHRYLIGLAVATPALLWPLWKGFTARGRELAQLSLPSRWPVLLVRILCALILLAFVGALVRGTVDTLDHTASSEVVTQRHQVLAASLLRMHLQHIYSEYWTCNLIAFTTREQIICSVLDEHLQPGFNRYTPYAAIVAHDPASAYVFPLHSPQARALASRAAQSSQPYRIMQFDNYIVYQPMGGRP